MPDINEPGMGTQTTEPGKGPDKTEPDWKALSRKHEEREKENWEALQKANHDLAERDTAISLKDTEIAELNARIARQELMLQDPALFDEETLAQCKASTPDEIKAWGEGMTRFAERLRARYGTPAPTNATAPKAAPGDGNTPDNIMKFSHPATAPNPKGNGPSPKELYEKSLKARTLSRK